ncbi:MAG: GNAT family N-acetyltransferase [Candidatus Entotheonellia bacterium]
MIYDRAARGYPTPTVPMMGFVMYEVTCGVGFILRLMIDRKYQRQGYGRAALVEVIRRLKLRT